MYSKHLKAPSIKAAVEAAEEDEDLLNLTGLLRLWQGRLIELLGKLDMAESSERARTMKSRWYALRQAQRDASADPTNAVAKATIGETMRDLDRLFQDIDKDYMTWRDIAEASDQVRVITKQEQDRRLAIGALIDATRAKAFAYALTMAVQEFVPDVTIQRKIQQRIMTELSREVGTRVR